MIRLAGFVSSDADSVHVHRNGLTLPGVEMTNVDVALLNHGLLVDESSGYFVFSNEGDTFWRHYERAQSSCVLL